MNNEKVSLGGVYRGKTVTKAGETLRCQMNILRIYLKEGFKQTKVFSTKKEREKNRERERERESVCVEETETDRKRESIFYTDRRREKSKEKKQ